MCWRLSRRMVWVVIIPSSIQQGWVGARTGRVLTSTDPARSQMPMPLALTDKTIATDQAANAVHHEAHGLVSDEIVEVSEH